MTDEFCLKKPDFHVTFRYLLQAVNLRHGTNGFTSLPKEGVLRTFFRPEKSDGFGPGFEPANLGTQGQHATSRPPKPLWNDINRVLKALEKTEDTKKIDAICNLRQQQKAEYHNTNTSHCASTKGRTRLQNYSYISLEKKRSDFFTTCKGLHKFTLHAALSGNKQTEFSSSYQHHRPEQHRYIPHP